MRVNHKFKIALALMTLVVPAVAFTMTAQAAQNAPAPRRVIAIQGAWTGRAPGPAGEIEVGENHDAGLLNGTFVVNVSTFEFTTLNGAFIINHQDVLTSATHTHRDATGKSVPDTIKADLTVTVILENGLYRSTFIGMLSDGTGVFTGATGYYMGLGTQVATPPGGDPTALYFSGTIGGELRLP
jgi:hypothetical protein